MEQEPIRVSSKLATAEDAEDLARMRASLQSHMQASNAELTWRSLGFEPILTVAVTTPASLRAKLGASEK
jgi:hypothetical protein